MEISTAALALTALAQESRLRVFRLLVRAGADGLSAGEISSRLGVSPPTLSFHLKELRHAGLVDNRRQGRMIFHSVNFERMNGLMEFLLENCCSESDRDCAPLSAIGIISDRATDEVAGR